MVPKEQAKKLKGCNTSTYPGFRYGNRTVPIHKIIFAKFSKTPLKYKNEINHKDGKKSNYHFSNLEQVTHKENMRHMADNKLSKNIKMSWSEVNVIRDLYQNFKIIIRHLRHFQNGSKIDLDREMVNFYQLLKHSGSIKYV